MKDYKQYIKSKSRGIKGSATLEPPAGGQSALQSVASGCFGFNIRGADLRPG